LRIQGGSYLQVHDDFNERIKREVRLESYISRFVPLKQQGKRYLGLCPFHQEKSPSFTVSPELGFYHCFGCGKSGDIFSFVMGFEGVNFPKAREILSEYSGIPLSVPTEASSKVQTKKEALLKLNEKVSQYFHSNLLSVEGKFALEYLRNRGITDSEIRFFKIGYALPGFQNLLNTVLKESAEVQDAKEIGLLKESSKRKNEFYDFFRDRIMFPILDKNGNTAGFGGRTIHSESEEAKYINSPASIIYDKGSMFYNLFHASMSMRKTKVSILVEGYLDVIGLFSKDIQNVVAPLGTGLTEQQVRTLKNYSDTVLVLFDGDNAGKKAAFRACSICLKEKMTAKVFLLNDGIDPFDLSKQKSKAELNVLFTQGLSSSDFLLAEVLGGVNESSKPELKTQAIDRLYKFVTGLQQDTDKEIFLEMGSIRLGLQKTSVINDFFSNNKHLSKFTVKDSTHKTAGIIPTKIEPIVQCERSIVSMLVLHDFLIEFYEDVQELDFQEDAGAALWSFIYTRYLNEETVNSDSILSSELDDSFKNFIRPELIQLYEVDYASKEEIKQIFIGLLRRHKYFLLQKQIQAETRKLSSVDVFSSNKEALQGMSDRLVFLRNEVEKYRQ
jgi:DNA primase